MREVVLTDVRFERSILRLECELIGIEQYNIKSFFFLNKLRNEKVKVRLDNTIENRICLYVPVLAALHEYPMTTGDWHLMVQCLDGETIIPRVDAQLANKIRNANHHDTVHAIFDKNASNHFYAFSKIIPSGNEYFLSVDYQSTISKASLIGVIKRELRILISYIKNRVYVLSFAILNKIIPKNGKRVLFTSSSRNEIGGNEEFVFNKMLERGLDKEYDIQFNFKESIKSHRGFKQKIHFVKCLATADYIFMDDYQPEVYMNNYEKGVKVIQLWHACGAFKTLGFERLDKSGAPKFNTRVHKCYTHVPVSSDHSVKHHAEAFAIDEEKFYPIGVARTDIFFDERYKQKMREHIYTTYPKLSMAKKVILFAPTFRGDNARNAYFPMEMIDVKKMGESLKAQSAVMIIKMHPFITQKLDIPARYSDYFIDASEYREINDFLFVTDLLITDYSSVIYEMSLLKKPMLFYAFDLDTYEKDRGFYEPYKDIVPGKIVYTIDELVEEMNKDVYDDELLEKFIKKNFKYTDGKSTDRVVDLIFYNKLPG